MRRLSPERPLRVVLVTQHFAPERSGNASRASDMVEKLAALGVDVTVLSPHPTFPHGQFPRRWRLARGERRGDVRLVNLFTWQPVRPHPGFVARLAYFLVFAFLAAAWVLLRARRYDAIVTSSPPIFTGIPGLAAKVLLRKPWLIEFRDSWLEGAVQAGYLRARGLPYRLGRALEGACLRRADGVGTTTRTMADETCAAYPGLARDKFFLLPNGVDTARFRPMDGPKEPRIVYAGNIGVIQDLDLVILAMREVRQRHPHVRLALAGGGDTEPELRRLVAREGLQDAVEFLGPLPRDEVPRLLAASLAGVAPIKRMPATRFVIPTKAYEYMAAGIPYVACGEGEIRLLSDQGGGLVADNAAASIAKCLLALLDDPDYARRLGEQGRRHVMEHYDRGAIARRLHERLLAATEGRRRG